jgi:hypothetical protein
MMDTETTREAELLRDVLVEHDWIRCFGLVGTDENFSWWIRAESGWMYDDGVGVPFVSSRDDIVPDLDAPATWGVLLGLLHEATAAEEFASFARDGVEFVVWAGNSINLEGGAPLALDVTADSPGLALSRAVRAALGAG